VYPKMSMESANRAEDVYVHEIERSALLPRSNSGCSLARLGCALDGEAGHPPDAHNAVEDEQVLRKGPECSTYLPRVWGKADHRSKLALDEPSLGKGMPKAPRWETTPIDVPTPIYVPAARRSFDTLGEALQHAEDGTELELLPGVYAVHGPVEVCVNNLRLCAAANSGTAVVEIQLRGPGASFIVDGTGLTVVGISFVQCACASSEAPGFSLHKRGILPATINVLAGDAHFEDCKVTSSLSHGICIWNAAAPCFEKCSITKCIEAAVLCRNCACPSFRANDFTQNRGFAIVVMDEAAGSFERNTIAQNAKCAVICGGSSSSSFENNVISDGLQGEKQKWWDLPAGKRPSGGALRGHFSMHEKMPRRCPCRSMLMRCPCAGYTLDPHPAPRNPHPASRNSQPATLNPQR
jgi:hypothetical protein